MDNIYLAYYSTPSALRQAPHSVDEQGRVQCLRVHNTSHEGRMEVRQCVKCMLESRVVLARDSPGVYRAGTISSDQIPDSLVSCALDLRFLTLRYIENFRIYKDS